MVELGQTSTMYCSIQRTGACACAFPSSRHGTLKASLARMGVQIDMHVEVVRAAAFARPCNLIGNGRRCCGEDSLYEEYLSCSNNDSWDDPLCL